jgi:biofilm PGA synthesis N-glycosyltransferase PgaC
MLLAALFYIFIITGTINLVHFALYLVGANLYDIKAIRRGKKARNTPLVAAEQPLVSILIPAFNEERVIRRCLQSVWDSTYQNIEIIVVNDGSKDKTSLMVKRYISSRLILRSRATIVHTEDGFSRIWQRKNVPISRQIYLIEQENGGKAAGLNNALANRASGEFVMTIDADSILHKDAVTNAVKYFADPRVVGVAANVRIIEEMTILGLLQRFEHMISYRSKKFFTVANCEFIVGGVASTYRRSLLDTVGHYDIDTITEDIGLSMKIAAHGNRENRLVYAADVAAMTEGVSDFKTLLRQRFRWKLGNLQNLVKYNAMFFNTDKRYSKMLTFYRVPMAFFGEILLLLEPIVLGYVIYLSFLFDSPAMIIGAYVAITIYLLLTIMPDEHLTLKGKAKAGLYAPIVYFIFYIMNVVQLVSIIRCIINVNKILDDSKRDNHWISPARRGKSSSFS